MNDINLDIQDTPNTDMEVQEQADIEFNLSEVPAMVSDDYSKLINKPSINGVTLQGNKTSNDLGLVAKETGKGLSQNDFTNQLKSKLEGIEEGATKVEKTSDITNDSGFIDKDVNNLSYYRTSSSQDAIDNEIKDDIDAIESDIDNIDELIPSQATSQNQLADKNFVNSSIATNTAYHRGTFDIVNDLELPRTATHLQVATALGAKIAIVTNNDYAFVSVPNEVITSQVERYDRYKYTNGTGWSYEFTLNNSSFTANQWATITSGLSSSDKTKIDGIENGAQVNDLEGVQVGGVDLPIDANKKVNVPVAEANELGVIQGGAYGFNINEYGYPIGTTLLKAVYDIANALTFISKGTLENVMDAILCRADKVQALTDAQKLQARSNIGTQKIWSGTTEPTAEIISEMAIGDLYVMRDE